MRLDRWMCRLTFHRWPNFIQIRREENVGRCVKCDAIEKIRRRSSRNDWLVELIIRWMNCEGRLGPTICFIWERGEVRRSRNQMKELSRKLGNLRGIGVALILDDDVWVAETGRWSSSMEPFWPTKKVKGTPWSAVDYGRLLSFSFFFPLESGNRNWFSRSRCIFFLLPPPNNADRNFF